MGHLDDLQDSENLQLGAKIMNYAKSGEGKSHDFYISAPRPLLVCDSDSSADKFADGRFPAFKRKGVFSMAVLQELLDELIVLAERGEFPFKSVLIDSLTVIVDKTIRDLGIDVSDVKANAKGQSIFAREAKNLTYKFRVLSNFGINICVTSEERTRYVGGVVSKDTGHPGASLSPSKFRFAFDFVYQKSTRTDVLIDKSRYVDWEEDKAYSGWNAAVHLKPIFEGKAKKQRGMETFNPATNAHEVLMNLLKERKSVQRGGVIPNDIMPAYIALANSDRGREGDVQAAIAEIEATYPALAERAAAAA